MPIFRLEGDEISNAKLVIAQETNLELESHLEDWLENSPWALIQDELILWIGRQTSAPVEGRTMFPDLLAVDSEGNLIIIELKRGKAPWEVVAQLLEYAAWANELSDEQIHEIAETYFESCNEFQEKTFSKVFKKIFDIPKTDDLPPLNRKLRLYIVAEDVPTRVVSVCRFLRTSYRIDVSCITVSMFQTKSGEKIVSMETKVGDESFPSPGLPDPDPPPNIQVVRETVQELTGGNTDFVFAPKDVKKFISEKYPNFKLAGVGWNIRIDTVNQSAFDVVPVIERKYWQIERGKYRLYDPEKDKVQNHSDANQTVSEIADTT
ncbi:hypothetical protein F4212_15280 [Candidatus Poribacteria bacterium]|nr:hypothetical protein [Candidatus Poribacteria bacterium]